MMFSKMSGAFRSLLLASVISAAALAPALAKDNPGAKAVISYGAIQHPVLAKNGMVSAQDRIAAEVGRDILARGGNAIAVSYTHLTLPTNREV